MTRPAQQKTLTRLHTLFDHHRVVERADRLRLCSDHAGRRLTSSAQLTEAEAARLVARLDGLPVGSLQRVLAHLIVDEENLAAVAAARSATGAPAAARPTILVCGATMTEQDQAVVREFTEQLSLIPPGEETSGRRR